MRNYSQEAKYGLNIDIFDFQEKQFHLFDRSQYSLMQWGRACGKTSTIAMWIALNELNARVISPSLKISQPLVEYVHKLNVCKPNVCNISAHSFEGLLANHKQILNGCNLIVVEEAACILELDYNYIANLAETNAIKLIISLTPICENSLELHWTYNLCRGFKLLASKFPSLYSYSHINFVDIALERSGYINENLIYQLKNELTPEEFNAEWYGTFRLE
jgi:hypothetical protein